jgi:hypothetical protein
MWFGKVNSITKDKERPLIYSLIPPLWGYIKTK